MMSAKKILLAKSGYVERKLQKCPRLQKRACSEQAKDLLTRMLRYEAGQRITASEALSHPFILKYCHSHLGEVQHSSFELDPSLVDRLRLFAKAPRLKKVARLFMAHLADHEKDLLVVRHNFRSLDKNGDGEITREELEAGLLSAGMKPPSDMAEIFVACGGHREGKLHFLEFLACLLPEELVDERLCHEAFNLLDPEGKGRLTAEDLRLVCPSYDLQRCQKMVRQANGSDGAGSFDFHDFYSFLCAPAPPSKASRKAGDGEKRPHQEADAAAEVSSKMPRLNAMAPSPCFVGVPATSSSIY